MRFISLKKHIAIIFIILLSVINFNVFAASGEPGIIKKLNNTDKRVITPVKFIKFRVAYFPFISKKVMPDYSFLKKALPNSLRLTLEKRKFETIPVTNIKLTDVNDRTKIYKIGKSVKADLVLCGEYTITKSRTGNVADFTVYVYDINGKKLVTKIHVLGGISVGIFGIIDRTSNIVKQDITTYSRYRRKLLSLKQRQRQEQLRKERERRERERLERENREKARKERERMERERRRREEEARRRREEEEASRRKRERERLASLKNKQKSKIYHDTHIASAGGFKLGLGAYMLSQEAKMYLGGTLNGRPGNKNYAVTINAGIGIGSNLELNMTFNMIPLRDLDSSSDPEQKSFFHNPEIGVLWKILKAEKQGVNLLFKFGFQPQLSTEFLAGPYYEDSNFCISSAWSFNFYLFIDKTFGGTFTLFVKSTFSYQYRTDGEFLHYFSEKSMNLVGFPEEDNRHHYVLNIKAGFDLKFSKNFVIQLGFMYGYAPEMRHYHHPGTAMGETWFDSMETYSLLAGLFFPFSEKSVFKIDVRYFFDNEANYKEGPPGGPLNMSMKVEMSNMITIKGSFIFSF